MSERETKRSKNTYLVAILVCLCFFACSLFFVFYMMKQNEAENIQYLHDTAAQNCTAVEKQVSGDFQTLEGIAICIGEAGLEAEAQLRPILKKINDNNSFIRMGLAGPDGKMELLDINGGSHQGIDVSDQEFFKTAMNGNRSISDVFLDSLDNEDQSRYINYYGVPVVRNGEIAGVLCAVNSSMLLRQIVDAPVFNGKGFSSIFSAEGATVIRSVNTDLAFNTVVQLKHLEGLSQEAYQDMLLDMQTKTSGEFRYTSGGKEQVGVYQPTQVKDWYVFSMVPRETLKQRYAQTAAGTFGIIVAACLIFLYLLYRQSRMMNESRQALMALAYKDQLTGCRNLEKFLLDAAPYTEDSTVQYALWYADLKRFKYFNDVFGYGAGDQILKYMAEMFEACVGEEDLFCRVSADNFAGLKKYESRQELGSWFESLQQHLSEHLGGTELTAGNLLRVELCMGFYCMDESGEALSVADMVNRANMAQKFVKNRSGRKYAFFRNELLDHILHDAELEASGNSALEKGEFVFYLQPKVDIQQGNRIAGAEALVRWNRGEKGLIPPGKFIPLFERNGFIVQLDRYIFEQVCQWYSGYLASGRITFSVAINVSRIGMLQEDFVEYYSQIKEKYGIPDLCLELEFTESMIVDDEMFRETVRKIREKGFVCSMDDFGSGYSSLNLLKNLPMDVLKLDILFFQNGVDMSRERIVISSIIAMAKKLQIKTVAEGVEQPNQVEFLRESGCDIVQGYIFSRPLPLPQFEQMLQIIETKHFAMEMESTAVK